MKRRVVLVGVGTTLLAGCQDSPSDARDDRNETEPDGPDDPGGDDPDDDPPEQRLSLTADEPDVGETAVTIEATVTDVEATIGAELAIAYEPVESGEMAYADYTTVEEPRSVTLTADGLDADTTYEVWVWGETDRAFDSSQTFTVTTGAPDDPGGDPTPPSPTPPSPDPDPSTSVTFDGGADAGGDPDKSD